MPETPLCLDMTTWVKNQARKGKFPPEALISYIWSLGQFSLLTLYGSLTHCLSSSLLHLISTSCPKVCDQLHFAGILVSEFHAFAICLLPFAGFPQKCRNSRMWSEIKWPLQSVFSQREYLPQIIFNLVFQVNSKEKLFLKSCFFIIIYNLW